MITLLQLYCVEPQKKKNIMLGFVKLIYLNNRYSLSNQNGFYRTLLNSNKT